MKHLIVLISMILTPLLSISQQYQPIPDSNASWIVRQDDGYGGLMWHKFFLTGDTLINSTKYTKVFFRFDIADPEYCGAFRNGENGKSYWISRDSINEYLLRDFTKQTGDTVKNVAYEMDPGYDTWILDFIVDSTEFTNSGPYSYKIMYLSTVVEDTVPDIGFPLVWIEKIGTFAGGIVNTFVGDLSQSILSCMQYNDTIYYIGDWWLPSYNIVYQYGECNDPVGVDEESLQNNITVAPNPFTNRVSIGNVPEKGKTEVNILNILGRVVYAKTFTNMQGNNILINTTRLNSGIYILKIMSNEKLLFTRKIIKR